MNGTEFAGWVSRITASPTVAVLAAAERLRAEGLDVVDFGPGEPDFPTPEHIKRAAIRAIEENKTKYTATPGIAPLRKAVVEWHKREFGSGFAPEECGVTVGGKHAIFNMVSVLVRPGDEVVIPRPYWMSYPDIVKYAGGEPVYVDLRAKEGFGLHTEDLLKVLTPRTRMLIVNSPGNPTGAVYAADQCAQILAQCEKRDIWLLSDECYSHFVYGGAKPFSVAGLEGAKSRLLIAGSVSKTFAMTGWRIGYGLGPKAVVEAMIKLQSQSTSNAASVSQYAALEAMTGPMDSVGKMLDEYGQRRKRILEGLRAIPNVTCTTPEGAFYAFPNVNECVGRGTLIPRTEIGGADTATIARELLEKKHLVVLAGDAFGAPGYLRISYATSMAQIEKGLKRLEEYLGGAEAAS